MDISSNAKVAKQQTSKIYKMTSTNGKVYIGCTTQKYITARLRQHKSKAKTKADCTSRELFETNPDGTEPIVSIELLEEILTENRSQQKALERKYIESTICVNKNIAGRSVAESNKAYNECNKDKRKAWREANQDKILGYRAMWRQKNIQKVQTESEMKALKEQIDLIELETGLKE